MLTSGPESQTYSVVLYGDISGDGKVDALDLLKLQKHKFNISKLSGAYFKAADISKDGKIDALDLLLLQKHKFGQLYISQI